jgi:uncharacterized membrane protein
VHAAVEAAERATGLEFCVAVVHRTGGNARQEAEALFAEHGLHDRPAVLVLVAPYAQWVEVVTAPAIQTRLRDTACRSAVDVMVGHFRSGAIAAGLEAGVAALAEAAGPADTTATTTATTAGTTAGADLPDVLA